MAILDSELHPRPLDRKSSIISTMLSRHCSYAQFLQHCVSTTSVKVVQQLAV